MTLEGLVRRLVGQALPERLAADAAADLLDDYRRVRHARGAAPAALWLLREISSLTAAFALAWVTRLLRSSVLIRRDAAHAVRSLIRRPGSSLGIILMMAAGLAAVAAAYGLASTLLFRPISQAYPDQVRRLAGAERTGRIRLSFSEVELARVREHLAGTADLATANLQPVVLRIGATATQTLAEVVGGRYLDLLGLEVAMGRLLMAGDSAPGSAPVAVISQALWRNGFGADPAVLGGTLRLNGRAFTIVGVTTGASPSTFLGGSVDAWITPAHADAMLSRNWRTDAADRWWTVLVRVNEPARAELDAALARASADLASHLPEPWRERTLLTVPGTVLAGSQREAAATLSIVLTAFAILILAAAAANVGGLFLAGAAADRGRVAIQLAIGSGRAAILRRQLIEGALAGAAAGVGALMLYAWIRRLLAEVALLPTLSLRLDLPLDAEVATTTIAAGVLGTAVLALGPALWTTRLDLTQTLRAGTGRTGSATLPRARRALVAAQVAISITLLSGAAMFARSMDTLATLDVGFPRRGLIAMDFDVEPSTAPPMMLPDLAREALARAAAVPGVVAAAMSNRAPIDSSTPAVSVGLPGSGSRPLDDVTFYLATERYFETVGVPIVHGRAFTSDEVMREDEVAIVNETLAGRLWPDRDVLGRAFVIHPQGRTVRIVGVARDSKYRSLSEGAQAHLYLPARPAFSRALLVRTQDDPRAAMLAVQAALDQVGPGVVGFFPRTLDDHLAIDLLPTRASARASVVLGALALLLSASGLYGVVMWFVETRRREIGVRMALGASANDVRRLVVREAMVAAGPGLAIGAAMTTALTLFGRSWFTGIGQIDAPSLGLGVGILLVVTLAASYLPSRRATRVDPLVVLRDS